MVHLVGVSASAQPAYSLPARRRGVCDAPSTAARLTTAQQSAGCAALPFGCDGDLTRTPRPPEAATEGIARALAGDHDRNGHRGAAAGTGTARRSGGARDGAATSACGRGGRHGSPCAGGSHGATAGRAPVASDQRLRPRRRQHADGRRAPGAPADLRAQLREQHRGCDQPGHAAGDPAVPGWPGARNTSCRHGTCELLWVTNDQGNSLTPINPVTGRPGRPIPVADPYNLYFTPDGTRAIVVAERLHRLDFRDPHTMRLMHSLQVPCAGVNHADFSATAATWSPAASSPGRPVKVDVRRGSVIARMRLPAAPAGSPRTSSSPRTGRCSTSPT